MVISRLALLGVLLSLLLASWGCTEPELVCVPDGGSCECPNGEPGVVACTESGGFG